MFGFDEPFAGKNLFFSLPDIPGMRTGRLFSANEDEEMCVNCSGAFSQKMYSIVEIQGCQITLALSKTSVKLRLLMQQLL